MIGPKLNQELLNNSLLAIDQGLFVEIESRCPGRTYLYSLTLQPLCKRMHFENQVKNLHLHAVVLTAVKKLNFWLDILSPLKKIPFSFYLLFSIIRFRVVKYWPWIHDNPKNFEPQRTYQLCGPSDGQHRVAPLRAAQERVFEVSAGSCHHALLSSKHVHETVESWGSHMLHRHHHLQPHQEPTPDSLCSHGNSTHSFGVSSNTAYLSWLQHEGRFCFHQHLGQLNNQRQTEACRGRRSCDKILKNRNNSVHSYLLSFGNFQRHLYWAPWQQEHSLCFHRIRLHPTSPCLHSALPVDLSWPQTPLSQSHGDRPNRCKHSDRGTKNRIADNQVDNSYHQHCHHCWPLLLRWIHTC